MRLIFGMKFGSPERYPSLNWFPAADLVYSRRGNGGLRAITFGITLLNLSDKFGTILRTLVKNLGNDEIWVIGLNSRILKISVTNQTIKKQIATKRISLIKELVKSDSFATVKDLKVLVVETNRVTKI